MIISENNNYFDDNHIQSYTIIYNYKQLYKIT